MTFGVSRKYLLVFLEKKNRLGIKIQVKYKFLDWNYYYKACGEYHVFWLSIVMYCIFYWPR